MGMSITTIEENPVHYEALGRGEPLIYIHGWYGSWRYWWTSMQALSIRNRTFALDLWGYGDSGKFPEGYNLNAYVSLLERFIERLGLARPLVLIGHALGAAIAVRYAIKYPRNIRRLITVSLPIEGRTINDGLIASEGAGVGNRKPGERELYSEVYAEISKMDSYAAQALAGQLKSDNFVRDLEELLSPILMIFGDNDPIVSQPSSEFLSWYRPRSGQYLVTLEGCMHFPMLEQPAVFNRLLKDFIYEDKPAEIRPKDYWQRRTR